MGTMRKETEMQFWRMMKHDWEILTHKKKKNLNADIAGSML